MTSLRQFFLLQLRSSAKTRQKHQRLACFYEFRLPQFIWLYVRVRMCAQLLSVNGKKSSAYKNHSLFWGCYSLRETLAKVDQCSWKKMGLINQKKGPRCIQSSQLCFMNRVHWGSEQLLLDMEYSCMCCIWTEWRKTHMARLAFATLGR